MQITQAFTLKTSGLHMSYIPGLQGIYENFTSSYFITKLGLLEQIKETK
jgi:hypothetical protein